MGAAEEVVNTTPTCWWGTEIPWPNVHVLPVSLSHPSEMEVSLLHDLPRFYIPEFNRLIRTRSNNHLPRPLPPNGKNTALMPVSVTTQTSLLFAALSVIKDDFGIGADRNQVLPVGGEGYIMDKFGMFPAGRLVAERGVMVKDELAVVGDGCSAEGPCGGNCHGIDDGRVAADLTTKLAK